MLLYVLEFFRIHDKNTSCSGLQREGLNPLNTRPICSPSDKYQLLL